MTDPQMVVCRICNLLVGWSEQKVDFVCIPCFDSVRIVRSQDTPGSQGEPA
jgi:predicted RNA-binding Zn-ribbon protein involved in translation (DUF1610 family)